MKERVMILLDNNKSRIVGSLKAVKKLREIMKLKSPGYFYSPAWRSRQWDGFIRYVTDTGTFATGHLDQVCKALKNERYRFTIEDGREHFRDLHEVTSLGDLESRPYQLEAVRATLANKMEGVKYIRGVL